MKCWKRAFDGTSTYVHIQCTATAQQISKFKIYDNNINESFIEIAAKHHLAFHKKETDDGGTLAALSSMPNSQLVRRNKGIDRYRTDFSQGFFYSPKLIVNK